MDWSKAKNILIIAFIVTNIFLAYVISVKGQDQKQYIVEDQLIVETLSLLKQENIMVDADIPKSTPSLPIISLEYERYNPETIAKRILGSYKEKEINGESIYASGLKQVRFEGNNKKLIYEDLEKTNRGNTEYISKKEAIKKSQQFIKETGFSLENAELGFHLEQDGIHTIEYNRVLNGVAVEQTNMTVKVSSQGVVSFKRYWIKNIEVGDKTLMISSAPKALLRLLAREEYYGKTIKQIDISYYFNIDEYKNNIRFNDSTGGVAIPTWRFIFEDGEKAFLEED